MQNQKFHIGKSTGAGLLAALASSACCILPAVAFVAGISGFASIFSWLEPIRPYLAGIAIISLSFAWFSRIRQIRKEKQGNGCEYCEPAKTPFFKSTGFLATITVFALLMIAFPYYSGALFNDKKTDCEGLQAKGENTRVYQVKGMTCQSCERHIESSLKPLKAIESAKASYQKGAVRIQYEEKEVPRSKVQTALEKAGYSLKQKN